MLCQFVDRLQAEVGYCWVIVMICNLDGMNRITELFETQGYLKPNEFEIF